MSEAFEYKEGEYVPTTIVKDDPSRLIARWVSKKQFIRYRHTLENHVFKHPQLHEVKTILHCIGNFLLENKQRERPRVFSGLKGAL